MTDDGCETFPTNLTAYTEYIKDFAAALIARYGEDEVASKWLFEVYNEADLHWSFDMYAQLYQAAAKGVKSVSGHAHCLVFAAEAAHARSRYGQLGTGSGTGLRTGEEE